MGDGNNKIANDKKPALGKGRFESEARRYSWPAMRAAVSLTRRRSSGGASTSTPAPKLNTQFIGNYYFFRYPAKSLEILSPE